VQQRKLECIRGRAKLETVHRGTGSEHLGVTLKDSNGKKCVLVRIGGNPFNDVETRKLHGRNVEVEGYRVGNQLHYVSAREIRRPRPTTYQPKKIVE
jgi:hypothetical protein